MVSYCGFDKVLSVSCEYLLLHPCHLSFHSLFIISLVNKVLNFNVVIVSSFLLLPSPLSSVLFVTVLKNISLLGVMKINIHLFSFAEV